MPFGAALGPMALAPHCRPAGSESLARGGGGSAQKGSSACGSRWRSPAPAGPALPSPGCWPPSLCFAAAAGRRAPSPSGRTGWPHRRTPADGQVVPPCPPATHVLVQPDQQRAAPPQRVIVGLPVRRAVAYSLRVAHAYTLTLPASPRESRCRLEFCNNAYPARAAANAGQRTVLPSSRVRSLSYGSNRRPRSLARHRRSWGSRSFRPNIVRACVRFRSMLIRPSQIFAQPWRAAPFERRFKPPARSSTRFARALPSPGALAADQRKADPASSAALPTTRGS